MCKALFSFRYYALQPSFEKIKENKNPTDPLLPKASQPASWINFSTRD